MWLDVLIFQEKLDIKILMWKFMILDVGNYPKFKTVVQAKPRSICCHLEVEGCFRFSLCELPPKFSVTQVSEAPSYPSLVPFVLFYYRSNFGHVSLYHVNLESPCGELEAFIL